MLVLAEIATLLAFPGFGFTITFGVLSVWALRWLLSRAAGEKPLAHKELTADLLALGRGAVLRLRSEPNWRDYLALSGLGAAVAASFLLWRAVLWPRFSYDGDLLVFLALLSLPLLSAMGASDWRAREKGLVGERDGLLLLYHLVLVLTLLTPAWLTGSLSLRDIVGAQSATAPLATAWPGAVALWVGLLTVRGHYSALGSLFEEGLSRRPSALEAFASQVTRGVLLFAIGSALVLLLLTFPGDGLIRFLLFWPLYLIYLLVMTATWLLLCRFGVRRVSSIAWAPLGVLACLVIALSPGGM